MTYHMFSPGFFRARAQIEGPPPPDANELEDDELPDIPCEPTAMDTLTRESSTKDRHTEVRKASETTPYYLLHGGNRYRFFITYLAEYEEYDARMDLTAPRVDAKGFIEPFGKLEDSVLVHHRDALPTSALPMRIVNRVWVNDEGFRALSLTGYGSLMLQGPLLHVANDA